MERVACGDVSAVTSELSFLEVLIHPVRDGDTDLVEAYETILAASDIQLVPISVDILRTAVRFRVNQNLKSPDAIHAATALHVSCSHFLSNDTTFRRLTNISTIILSDLT